MRGFWGKLGCRGVAGRATACVLLLLAAAACAEPPSAQDLLRRFDADQDQKLDQGELQQAIQSLAEPAEQSQRQAQGVEAPKFIRVARDDAKRPTALETSIAHFVSADGKTKVDLIGAVHVADKAYYQKLNKRFDTYEAVLYELVAPEGTRIPRGGAPSQHPIGRMQEGIKSILELSFQLSHIDYTKSNLVHADMSPEEFAQSMKDRGESFLQILFRMMGQAAAQSGTKDAPSDAELIVAFFSPNRAMRLKRIMAEQFEDLESYMGVFEGPHGSTLISQRNIKALEVLREQLDDGKRHVAIFYGAGHLPDMARRLQDDFDLQFSAEEWLVAWKL